MTQQPNDRASNRHSRRRTGPEGLPYLAAKLPPDFASPAHINEFIYNLSVEVVAGRVDSRRAAVLGYLSQLGIQTLPLLLQQEQAELDRTPFTIITHIPRPKYTDDPPNSAQTETPVIPSLPEKQTSHVHR